MRAWVWIVLAGGILLTGCGRNEATAAVATARSAEGTDASQELYEKLHGGAFQFDSALEGLHSAVEALQPLPKDQGGETKEALLDVLDALDSVGRTLADHAESPTLDVVRQDPKVGEGRRTKAIEEVNEAYQELEDAQGTVEDMLKSGPPAKEKAALDRADSAMDDALDAMEEGVRLLGGKTPGDSDESKPDSPGG